MATEQKLPFRSRSHSPVKSPSQAGGDAGLSSSSKHAVTKQQPLPWFTESYFTSEPATAAARKIYITFLASRGVIIIVFLLSVLSIYWGALWQTPVHVHNLNCWVVVSLISHGSRDVPATRCVQCLYYSRYRTLTEGRWDSSSRARWSQVAGHQLRLRGARSPQICFRMGRLTSRMRSSRRKPGPS